MSARADDGIPAGARVGAGLDARWIGGLLAGAALLLILSKPLLPAGLIRPPDWLVLPFADWINAVFDFLRDDLGLIHVTRGISSGIEAALDTTANLLYGRSRWPHLGPIPWVVVAVTMAMAGYALRGWRLAALTGGTFVWIAVMGQWKWAMETLSVIAVATPVSVALGLVLGILGWRSPRFEKVLNPVLNLAQSLPHFAYMIPVVVFVGVGPKSGAIVTIIFSVPPMIRMTMLGLRRVAPEIIEAGQMCGASRWQVMTRVRLPAARTEILIGVNQVIMQSLAMVVLASFIGMPGLGQKLLQLLQALKIGLSFEIGITIVLLAVALDRLSKAWAQHQPAHPEHGASWASRNRLWLVWAGLVALGFLLASVFPYFHVVGRSQALSLAGPIDAAMDALIQLVKPVTDWLRWFLIGWVLIPLRNAILWLPYAAILLALAALGWRIGGWRSAAVCLAFFVPIALSGWWDRAMITVYTVCTAVTLALLVGLPLGIWAARDQGRATRVLLLCDTFQTFPSFIYLIPVVMLFGVNDVAVVAAVVVFAAVPLIRYTVEGLRNVPSETIEAAEMSGATRRQILWSVRMPLALPTLMVGLNQSVMFALFMVIIAAFIGTQDLGQEMQRALSSTDVGKGLVLGLAVAFMGLMVDHLLMRWAARRTV
ncbi:glycine betaine/proline transport system permease protein [Paracoccus aminovorans]|uniref:Glycine betaine/proline transport system permease protein n=1 Tax=Paracoccus aminovorans TaxID=34004 RepID=A0A1I3B518_9RHOB|nr:ABC transporter permease subunit [Paracoccus aminovorans]CQR87555.1 glycine betaine/proline ABC transporter, permease protein [Paracoccus aminovorans]SFH57059.1 glycine betaine/proline transport system permease protein [Paracoccus aminovorans]